MVLLLPRYQVVKATGGNYMLNVLNKFTIAIFNIFLRPTRSQTSVISDLKSVWEQNIALWLRFASTALKAAKFR